MATPKKVSAKIETSKTVNPEFTFNISLKKLQKKLKGYQRNGHHYQQIAQADVDFMLGDYRVFTAHGRINGIFESHEASQKNESPIDFNIDFKHLVKSGTETFETLKINQTILSKLYLQIIDKLPEIETVKPEVEEKVSVKSIVAEANGITVEELKQRIKNAAQAISKKKESAKQENIFTEETLEQQVNEVFK